MRGVNLCILVGNVVRDPEVKDISSERKVANFSIATNETWKDKQTGEKKERVEFHRCQAWGALAGIIEQYVKKGSLLYVEGKIQTRKYQDKDGHDRYVTEINVQQMNLLGSKDGASSAAAPAAKPAEVAAVGEDDIPF